MFVQHKDTRETGYTSNLNPLLTTEALVDWNNSGRQRVPVSRLLVYLSGQKSWKDMHQAFQDQDLILDNDGFFFEKK